GAAHPFGVAPGVPPKKVSGSGPSFLPGSSPAGFGAFWPAPATGHTPAPRRRMARTRTGCMGRPRLTLVHAVQINDALLGAPSSSHLNRNTGWADRLSHALCFGSSYGNYKKVWKQSTDPVEISGTQQHLDPIGTRRNYPCGGVRGSVQG